MTNGALCVPGGAAAVLVTETLGERYRGTLQALAEHLPLVVVELAVWRGETEAIVVPHVALAASSVDLSTAPATAAATVLGACRPPRPRRAKASDPSGDSPVVDTVSDSVAEEGVDEAEERPEVIASAADAKEAADERTQGPEVVEAPLNKDDTGVTNPWRLLRRDETDPVRETTWSTPLADEAPCPVVAPARSGHDHPAKAHAPGWVRRANGLRRAASRKGDRRHARAAWAGATVIPLTTNTEGPVNIDSTLLLLIVPIVVIQLGLLIWGLYDLTRPDRRVKGDSKVVWALVIIFINIIGPIVYFLFGREEA